MLDAMRQAAPAAADIDVVVNTHANGDHCYGNQLVSGAEIVASSQCAGEMHETPPAMLAALMAAAPDAGAVGAYVRRSFGPFEFVGIELVPPTKTFEGDLEVGIGEKAV